MTGWDIKTGWPIRQKLGLKDVADGLQETFLW